MRIGVSMSFDNHPNAKKVFDYFQNKFSVGYLGMWHTYGVASIFNDSERHILSSLIIASAGSYKSQVMKDINKVYGKYIYQLPDQPTDRSLIKEANENIKNASNKLWTIDDAVTCFPTLDDARQKRFTNVFVRLIMDGQYSYSDSVGGKKELKARIGLFANVAVETFMEVKQILKTTTFLDRTVPFSYSVDPIDEIVIDRNYRRGIEYDKPPKLIFKRRKVTLPSTLDDEYDFLRYRMLESCEMSPSRASDWLKVILGAIAITEGRSTIQQCDVDLFREYIFPHLTTKRIITKIEMAILRMLQLNGGAIERDVYEFFESEVCKSEFPNDWKYFTTMNQKDLSKYFSSAKGMFERELEVKERINKVNINVK